MRRQERWEYLGSAPRVGWDAVVRGQYRFTFDTMPRVVRGMSWPARLNLLAAGLNLVHRRLRPWSWPLHMQIELTSFCELECPVCPTELGALNRAASAVDPELFEQVLREAGHPGRARAGVARRSGSEILRTAHPPDVDIASGPIHQRFERLLVAVVDDQHFETVWWEV